MGCSRKACLVATAFIGAIMIIIGGVLIPVGNDAIYTSVSEGVLITPDSDAYESWIEPPVPVYMEYWVWDLRNPEQFKAGQVPVFEQKGPYCYKEFLKKFDIVHNPNGTVSFKSSTKYVFERDLSVGPESDKFTSVNMVAFTLASFFKYSGRIPQDAIQLIHELAKAELTMELSVYDILWGYEDAYLKLFQDFLGEGTIPMTKFGIFLGSNNSNDGVWTVYDGVNDLSKINQVNVYNGMESLPWWSTPYANMINGTDGAAFHPYIQEDEQLYIFVPDICRSGYVLFDKTVKLKGIPVGEWYLPKELYANPSDVPDNVGFCTPDKYSCVPTGLINVTECYGGAPVYFSSPHFLYGENLLDTVDGLNPIEEEHRVYFALEMLLGVPFQVDNRLQINLRVEPYDFLPLSESIAPLYMPILWLNESTIIDDKNAELYKSDILAPQRILISFTYILLGLGGGMFIGSVIALCRSRSKKENIENFVQDTVNYVSRTNNTDPKLYEPNM